MTLGVLAVVSYIISWLENSVVQWQLFLSKVSLAKRGLDKASELSERYGAMMCFTGRIILTVRVFISLMSGVSNSI